MKKLMAGVSFGVLAVFVLCTLPQAHSASPGGRGYQIPKYKYEGPRAKRSDTDFTKPIPRGPQSTCTDDKQCPSLSYCFILPEKKSGVCQPPCHSGDCDPGFYCDLGKQEDPNDNRCVAEKSNGTDCPPGQKSPTGGSGDCQPDIVIPDVKLPKGDDSKMPPGCIIFKQTQVAGHLVRIEYAFKSKIDGVNGVEVTCPEIKGAYAWGPWIQLNSPATNPIVIQQSGEDEKAINDPSKSFVNDPSKHAKPCNSELKTDDTVCMGFKDYHDEAIKTDSKVWTHDTDQKYDFGQYTFWRVDGIDPSPSGKSDALKVLGYARIKSFYDENLCDEDPCKDGSHPGKTVSKDEPTHNFTPRIFLVVESNGELFQIQGHVENLDPTATVTMEALQNEPKWKATIDLKGAFDSPDDDPNGDSPKGDSPKPFDKAVTSDLKSCQVTITAANGSGVVKSGYEARVTSICNLSEIAAVTFAKVKGLNEYNRPVIKASYRLAPPTVTFKEMGCNQALGGKLTDVYDFTCTKVNGKGSIKLFYQVEGRKAELIKIEPDSNSQGSGSVSNQPGTTSTTVPWVKNVVFSSEPATTCKQKDKIIEIVTDKGVKGTEGGESSFTMLGIVSGNVIRDRDYGCFEYKIAVKGLNDKPVDFTLASTTDSINPIKAPYTPLFEHSLTGHTCHWDHTCMLPGLSLCHWGPLLYPCYPAPYDVYQYQGLDYSIRWKLQHVKEVSTTCEGEFFDATTSQKSKTLSPTEYAEVSETAIFEGKTKDSAAKCSFFITQYDGTKKTAKVMPQNAPISEQINFGSWTKIVSPSCEEEKPPKFEWCK